MDELTCEHRNNRACYRIFSNGTEHYGYQCVRCGFFRATKKDDWLRMNIKEACGLYESSIVDEWRRLQSEHRMSEAKENRETVLSEYYASKEWDRKRRARLRLNQIMVGGKCEMCLDGIATQCHHRIYTRFGNEWLLDLIACCEECHRSQHKHMQEQ
jgi:5-methylcytosine-specific restriction endonuclease McrA